MTPDSRSTMALNDSTKTSSALRRAGSVLLSLGALLVSTVAAATPSRTILYNGKVLTPNAQTPFAQAIAVTDDKVQATGTTQAMLALAKPGTKLIDLHGKTVIPGLNDAHVHILNPAGTYLNRPPFGSPPPDPTLDEVKALISNGVSTHPPGTWLVVLVGTTIAESEGVNRTVLDAISPHHPVKLEVWTGHGTYINTKAMQTLGISPTEPDPMGGHYERFPGTNTITGEAHEYAEHQIRRKQYATMSNADAAAFYHNFSEGAVTLGFTSVQDMAIGMPHARAIDILKLAKMKIRARSMCIPLTVLENCELSQDTVSGYPKITTSGLKWITDGTPVERYAFLNDPYLDKPDTSGTFNFTENKLDAMLFRGLLGPRSRNQTLFHAVGDGAIDKVLDGMEAMGGHYFWSGRRTRIEHGDLLFPENFPRMIDLGAVIVQNPTHFTLGAVFAERLQPEKIAMLEPLQTLLDTGIPLALGTDSIGQLQSPWVDIFFAVTHPFHPTEAISVLDAVRAYTSGSAYAEFEEGRKGTLAPGQKADLAVLSQDVFSLPPAALQALMGTSSVLTMIDGEIVWTAPPAPTP
jgi:predicted amidohydrolase YtcJ